MRSIVRLLLVAASVSVASLAAVSVAPRASACGMAIHREVDTRAMGIAKAERALQQGQFAAAALNVTQVFPAIRTAQPGADALQTRAMRVMALAVARADGAVTLGSDWRGATPAQRATNLEWAATTMRTVSAARAGDPSAQADLGEALAKIPRFQPEALKILDGLAQKDLLGSAQAYAALARLRGAAGDKPGRDAAVTKCQAMTQTPGLCAVPNS
jgi:hypothetical protein